MGSANSVGTLSVTVAGNATPMEKEFKKAQGFMEGFAASISGLQTAQIGASLMQGFSVGKAAILGAAKAAATFVTTAVRFGRFDTSLLRWTAGLNAIKSTTSSGQQSLKGFASALLSIGKGIGSGVGKAFAAVAPAVDLVKTAISTALTGVMSGAMHVRSGVVAAARGIAAGIGSAGSAIRQFGGSGSLSKMLPTWAGIEKAVASGTAAVAGFGVKLAKAGAWPTAGFLLGTIKSVGAGLLGVSLGAAKIVVPGALGVMAKGIVSVGRGALSAVAGLASFGLKAVALGPVLGGLAAVLGGGVFLAGSVQLAAEAEKVGVAYEVLTGNAETARKTLGDLRQLAVETPFSSRQLTDYGRSLLGMGVKADQLVPILSRLGEVSQGEGDKLGRLMLQFGQVMSKGRLERSDFKIFLEAGADIDAFAKAAGVAAPQLDALFEKGEIGADVMVNAINIMTSAGGRFHGLFSRLNGTFDGQLNGFMEKVENFRIAIGTAFLKGFKPGGFLESLTSGFGDLGKLEERLVPFFEKMRTLFDKVAAGAGALASVLLGRLGEGIGLLESGGAWKEFETAASMAVRGILSGVENLMDGLQNLRGLFKTALEGMAEALNAMAPNKNWRDDREARLGEAGRRGTFSGLWELAKQTPGATWDSAVEGGIGKDTLDPVGKAMRGTAKVIGILAKTLDGPAPESWKGKLTAKYDDNLKMLAKPSENAPPGERDLIKAPPKGMTKGASDWLNQAIEKPPTELQQFLKSAQYAQEVQKFQPANADVAFTKLAGEFLNMGRELENTLKVELPSAMRAGSSEAESIITKAMMDKPQSAQERLETVMRQARDVNERQLEELKKLVTEMKRMSFDTVTP